MQSLLDEADWYRATTLEERASSLRRLGSPVETDTEIAARSLDLWRAQTPFQREELLRQRFEMDDLSLADALALLGEPPEALRNRLSAPPPWLADLAAAFEDPAARMEPEEARELGLVVVVEPLVVRARARLRAAAEHIMAHQPRPLFEPDSAVQAFYGLLVANLGNALRRTMVLELHVAARLGQLSGATPAEQTADFFARLRRPEAALDLLRQYPVAARHVVGCADRWLAFASEVLAQLAADADLIGNTFHAGEDPGPLVEVQGGVSDPHRGERTVLLLRFRSGLRLVYKPKPLALDAAFQAILAGLNERGADPAFRPLLLVDRGAYGWVEFITPKPCASVEEIHRFYRRQGGYLALFHALAATDFHHENLLASGEHPIPIDLETLFHSSAAPTPGSREPLADEEVWNSVLRPGLLPQRIWARDNAGVDISGFGAVAGQVTSMPVLHLEGGDESLLRFSRKVIDMPIGPEHRPDLAGQEVDVRDYTGDITQGFIAVYRLLVRFRDDLLAPAGPLSACAEAPTRFIARPTIVYAKLLAESSHPYVLQDALDRDRLLDRLWVDVENRPVLAQLLPWEHRALEQGDIPLFTSRAGSPDLWTTTGERLTGLLAESGLERVRRVLLGMGEADLACQLHIVNGALKTLHMSSEEQVWPVYRFYEPELAAPADRFLDAARAVGDRLESLAFRQNGSATWLGFTRMGASRFWSFEPVNYGLYAGLSGIALFLGQLGAVTGESRYADLARAALAVVRARAADAGDLMSIGAFSGMGSILYTLLQLGTAWREPDLITEAEALVTVLPARIESDRNLDLLSGSAGCLLTLLRLHAVRPDPRTLAAAVLCGDRLLDQAQEMETGLGWLVPGIGTRPLTGLSHGAAGIGWALAELAAVTGEERFDTASRGVLAYERSLFSAEQGNWPDLREETDESVVERPAAHHGFMCAWCHGAPGIGLARLACLRLLADSTLREEIEVAVETTLAQGFGGNHSLCHGDLGNLDFLLEAGRRLARPDLLARVPRLASAILHGIEENGWISGSVLAPEIPGLMLGIAGIGYQLLRLAAVERVPSVLLLEPPRGGESL